MEDEQMRYQRPIITRNQLHQYLLDLHRVCLVGNAKANNQAADVRIHYDALIHAKRIAEDDVRCFAADARQTNELGHGVWYFAAVGFDDSSRHPEQALRLVAEETGAANHLLEP